MNYEIKKWSLVLTLVILEICAQYSLNYSAKTKQANYKYLGIVPYEELMSLSAPYLIEQRMIALAELERLAQLKHEELTGQKECFKIIYQMHPIFSKPPSSDEFLSALKKHRQKDLRVGFTSFGPHKDDLQVEGFLV